MKLLILGAALSFVPGLALADQLTLTNAEALDLQAGLRALGGLHEVIIREGVAPANVPYKLKASVVDIISRDLLALKPVNDALDMTRNALHQQTLAVPEGKERTAAEQKAEEDFRTLLLEKRTVELALIDPKDLDREAPAYNPIPALDMARLAPVLKTEDKK